MDVMPCGHNTSWMIRTLDKGIRFKLCLQCMCEGSGLKEDAYGNKFFPSLKKKEPIKKKVEVKKDDSSKKTS